MAKTTHKQSQMINVRLNMASFSILCFKGFCIESSNILVNDVAFFCALNSHSCLALGHMVSDSFIFLSTWRSSYQVRVITVFTVFRLLTDFVCLYTYEFWLSLWKIVRSSVILLLPLFQCVDVFHFTLIRHSVVFMDTSSTWWVEGHNFLYIFWNV
jgi:hypothetical protein